MRCRASGYLLLTRSSRSKAGLTNERSGAARSNPPSLAMCTLSKSTTPCLGVRTCTCSIRNSNCTRITNGCHMCIPGIGSAFIHSANGIRDCTLRIPSCLGSRSGFSSMKSGFLQENGRVEELILNGHSIAMKVRQSANMNAVPCKRISV